MPHNREPHVYQGSVISLIGVQAGTEIIMDYKNAQACVSSGTHRWIDDETDLPHPIQERIADRAAEEAAADEANRLAMEAKARGGAPGKIHVVTVQPESGDAYTYLSRPFPIVTDFSKALLDSDNGDRISIIDGATDDDVAQDGDIIIKLHNAIGRYRPISETEDTVTAKLQDDVVQPTVDIPADWRDRQFLQNIVAAKAIRGSAEKMTKDNANAIIEEWTRKDDQVQVDPAAAGDGTTEGKEAQASQEGFKDANGNPVTAAQKAELDAKELAHDKEND